MLKESSPNPPTPPPPTAFLRVLAPLQKQRLERKKSICEAGPRQETLPVSKKTNNLPFLKILEKTHTYNELFTKAEPKNA